MLKHNCWGLVRTVEISALALFSTNVRNDESINTRTRDILFSVGLGGTAETPRYLVSCGVDN
jgi:hypothetical protein